MDTLERASEHPVQAGAPAVYRASLGPFWMSACQTVWTARGERAGEEVERHQEGSPGEGEAEVTARVSEGERGVSRW